MIAEAKRLLDEAVVAGVTPGAQLCVLHRARATHLSCHGLLSSGGGSVTDLALYDVASVTKAAATTLAAFTLLSKEALSLQTEVRTLLPEFHPDITVLDLLLHGSGLPAWRPLFAGARSPAQVLEALYREPTERPRGQAVVYSDLGFMVLGEALARAAGAPLDRFFAAEVAGPLGLPAIRFFDLARGPPDPRLAVAATGRTRPREPAPGQEGLYGVPRQAPISVPGEVDDDNAYALGGVAGHAGLFSSASDMARLGSLLLEELAGAGRLGDPAVLAGMVAPRRLPEGPARALGFDVPAPTDSAAGTLLGKGPLGAFGHLGFTGCSLWVDRDRELSVALFTNRVHETRSRPEGIRRLRQAVHDAVCLAVEGEG